ncbi:hypothetical protein D3C75_884840 [compost metagenome]
MAGFITQRPDNNRGMVEIAQHHSRDAFGHRGEPHRIVTQTFHRHHTVSFNICFVDHVHSVFVAQPIPERVIGVMRAAHRIKVMLFHQHNVLAHGFCVHHLAMDRVMLMAVGAADQQRFAVKFQQALLDFDFTETHVIGFRFNDVARAIAQHHHHAI